MTVSVRLTHLFRIAVVALTTASFQVANAGALEKLFAPRAKLWSYWSESATDATASVDHAPWDTFLREHVKPDGQGVNRIDYSAVPPAAVAGIKAYIDTLQSVPVTALARDEQFAFWVNLYNALTVDVVLDNYPVASIRKIKLAGGLFSRGPWAKKLVTIEGKEVSLNDIEHRILRPIWQDPRIHYAVNCASLGCPNLMATAFTPDNSEPLLERGAREFVNHPRGARIENGKLVVSSIYSWFESDFGGDQQGVIRHLSSYADGNLAAALAGVDRIADDDYDWSLNDAGK